ncbi:MAG TPA: winged helix DNA-binding domain-containing protein [Anaerolineales bacterium]
MKSREIPYERLLRQRIAGEGLEQPADVVRWMGAVQAQDFAAAKWAVGMRTAGCTEAAVESAFAAGEILRVHTMRPTWHFVAPEDLHWMQTLTAPRVNAILANEYRRLGLDAALLKRSSAVLLKALRDGKQRTRAELGSILTADGIPTDGLRLAHILSHAELEGIICSGGRRGKQFTYALANERAAPPRRLGREEGLALLTERYFTSHGPATLKDFAWWSGLTTADARNGLDMVKSRLVSDEIDGQSYWMAASAPAARFSRGVAYLLGNYDEYIVGYTDRKAIFDDSYVRHLDSRQNPLFQNTIVSRGWIVGTWKRTIRGRAAGIEAKPFQKLQKVEVRGVRQATERLMKFWKG